MTGEGRGPVFEAAMRMANVASDLRDRIDAALAIHKPCHDATALALGVEPTERTARP